MKSVEIEFKTLLSQQKYEELLQQFAASHTPVIEQTNYYFDTSDQKLAAAHCGLRIRLTSQTSEITLKSPLAEPDSLLETTEKLTVAAAYESIEKKQLPFTTEIQNKLAKLEIPANEIQLLGFLKTKRVEIPLDQHNLLVLDESWYNGCHDFELEMETQLTPEAGRQFFTEFLTKQNIPYQKSRNKVQRMLQTL